MSGFSVTVAPGFHGSNSTSSLVALSENARANACFPAAQYGQRERDDEDEVSDDDDGESAADTMSAIVIELADAPMLSIATSTEVTAAAAATVVSSPSSDGTSPAHSKPVGAIVRRGSCTGSVNSSNCPRVPVLLYDGDQPAGTVAADEDDIFSLESFSALLRLRQNAGKTLIIARVPTRSKQSAHCIVYSSYEATGLIRHIFRRIDDHVQHRYHRYQRTMPNNPLTNTSIVGEVKFYRCDIQRSDDADSGEFQRPIVATLIGTDYEYAYSTQFRQHIADNVIEGSADHAFISALSTLLLKPERSRRTPQYDANAAFTQQDDHIYAHPWMRYLARPFNRAAIYGGLLSLYIALTILIVEQGIYNLANKDTADGGLQIFLTSWWYFFFPLVSFSMDRLLSIFYRVKESSIVVLIKCIVYIAFYILPVAVFTGTDAADSLVRHLIQIVLTLALATFTAAYYWRLATRHTFHV